MEVFGAFVEDVLAGARAEGRGDKNSAAVISGGMVRWSRVHLVVVVVLSSGCSPGGDDGDPTTAPGTSEITTATTGSASSPTSTGSTTTGEDAPTSTGAPGTSSTTSDATTSAETTGETTAAETTGGSTTTGGACFDVLPTPGGPDAVLADEYVADYTVYDLGAVPKAGGGVLDILGGLAVFPDDIERAYIIDGSSQASGTLYVVPLDRGPCGHIIGFGGPAEPLLSQPYFDLMTNGPKGVVFISHYPKGKVSQIVPGEAMLASTTDLYPLGLGALWSPGGLAFVPPGYPGAGMLRVLGYPSYEQDQTLTAWWYAADITYNGVSYDIGTLEQRVELPDGPGGVAYIPIGSPQFPEQRIMVTEFLSTPKRVSSYAVDDQGDPIPESHKPFFVSFEKPWGSYFEPLTGDYMFLQFAAQGGDDHVYIVQGFVPPPPIPG